MKADGTKYRILLVEDDLSLTEIYKLRLEAEGFEVQTCSDGEQALSSAMQFRPDLILLDLMMPRISGFDALDILKQSPETSTAKVIVLTALSRPEDQEKAKQLGADEFIIKSQTVASDVIDRIYAVLGAERPAATSTPATSTPAPAPTPAPTPIQSPAPEAIASPVAPTPGQIISPNQTS